MYSLKNDLNSHKIAAVQFSFCLLFFANNGLANKIFYKFSDTLIHRDVKEAQQLLNNAKPGDTVFLKGGIYFLKDQNLKPTVSGTKKAWITIMPQRGEEVIFDGTYYLDSISKVSNVRGGPQKALIAIMDVKYVQLKNIKVRQSHVIGIVVEGKNTSNIHIVDCKSSVSHNSGIAIWYADSCKVMKSEITGANDQALRPAGQPLRVEAPHEALTLAGATNFEVAYNSIHDCIKEGIDCKEVSSYGNIHHNTVYNIPRQGLYVDCWFGRLHHIEFAYNTVYNCEWGFALSAEGKGATMDSIYAHHNLLYNNRGAGVLFGVWGTDGPRKQIYIYNNTIVNNGKAQHWSGLTGGIDIMSSNISDVFIYNNISAFNYGYAIATSVQPSDLTAFLIRQNVQITNNVEWQINTPGTEISKGIFKPMYPMQGKNAVIADPLFVNADKMHFQLKKSSPARNKGWKKAPYGKAKYLGYIQ